MGSGLVMERLAGRGRAAKGEEVLEGGIDIVINRLWITSVDNSSKQLSAVMGATSGRISPYKSGRSGPRGPQAPRGHRVRPLCGPRIRPRMGAMSGSR